MYLILLKWKLSSEGPVVECFQIIKKKKEILEHVSNRLKRSYFSLNSLYYTRSSYTAFRRVPCLLERHGNTPTVVSTDRYKPYLQK